MHNYINNPSTINKIKYISINSKQEINGFNIDNSVLMPIEISTENLEWQMENITWEMIIATMLKIFSCDPYHKDIEYYRKFIHAIRPSINEEMTHAGIIKIKNKDFHIAEEIFRALVNFDPNIEQNFINLVLVLEEQVEFYKTIKNNELVNKKIEEAFEVYKKALRMHPDSELLLFNIGYFYIEHGNMEKAIYFLERFVSVTKNSIKKKHTISTLNKIKKLSTDNLVFNESYELIEIGREELGIEKIKGYLKTNYNVWNAWFILGWAYRRKGEYQKGKEALLTSITLNEKNIDSYNELAICLLELGEYNECRKKLSTALRLDGDDIKIISNFGILAIKENNNKEAIGFFQTVLEIVPDDKIAKKYLEYLSKK